MIERGILYVADASSGNIKQNIIMLMKHLNRARYKPFLVISDDLHIAERLRESKIPYIVVPEISTAGKFNLANIAKKIQEFAEEQTINLVHSHSYQGCYAAAQVAKQLGVPHICTIYSSPEACGKKKGLFAVPNDKIAAMPNHLIAVSEDIKKSVEPVNDVTVIHSAVEADRFAETLDTEQLNRELGINKDDILVGTVMNIDSNEEVNMVLKIAQSLIEHNDKIHFAVAGNGQERESLKKKLQEMKVRKNIHLLGYRRDVAHVLKGLAVVIIINNKTGIPLILLEALAGIRPVVTVDTPGVREVANEECVKFAKVGDVDGIVGAVEYLLSNFGEAAGKASAGFKVVTEQFTAEQMIKSIQSLYLKVAG